MQLNVPRFSSWQGSLFLFCPNKITCAWIWQIQSPLSFPWVFRRLTRWCGPVPLVYPGVAALIFASLLVPDMQGKNALAATLQAFQVVAIPAPHEDTFSFPNKESLGVNRRVTWRLTLCLVPTSCPASFGPVSHLSFASISPPLISFFADMYLPPRKDTLQTQPSHSRAGSGPFISTSKWP